MKKAFIFLLIMIIFSLDLSAKELEGKDLQAVNKVLETKLYVNNFEELPEQLAYLEGIEKEIAGMNSEISEEAALICKNVLLMQKESAKDSDLQKRELKEKNKKKKKDKKKDPEKEKFAMDIFNEYKAFSEAHSDLSSVFHYRYKEAELSTLQYLSLGKQLEVFSTIMEDYKKIEAMNPQYAEILFTYGMALYMAPKIAGGNKELAVEKIKKAIDVSRTNYEKSSALLLYSQILLEEKHKDEAEKYFKKAQKLAPINTTIKELKEMNDAGYTMFHMQDYLKKKYK